MDVIFYVLIAIMVVMVALSAYFSCCETAYTSLNEIRVKNLVYEGDKRAEKALSIHENFDKLLTTILVGNNLVNAAVSTISTATFTELFGATIGVIAATIFSATVILIFGEITPKTLAKRNSERYALRFAGSLQMVTTILAPISWLFMKFTGFISRRAKNDSAEAPSFTEDELIVMIDEIEEEGTLKRRESELIKSAIQFDDIRVSDMYTPRSNIIATDVTTDVEEMKRLFTEYEFSRIPVFEGNIDRIIGVVYAKEFYPRYIKNKKFDLYDIVRPVKFVPERTSIAILLKDLQKSKIHLAIVLDNFGSTVGLVSMEDILEELVGDIWDESDEINYPIVEDSDGGYIVPGEAVIEDVMDRIGAKFERGDFEGHTINDYVAHMTEGIPKKGNTMPVGDVDLTIRSMKSRRVKEAKLIKRKDEPVSEDFEEDQGTEGDF